MGVLAQQTPVNQILPLAPTSPDIQALLKWAQDLSRTLQQNLAGIARKANDTSTVPLSGDLNASGFSITNINNLGNIAGTITYKGADIDARYVNTTGDTMTGNLLISLAALSNASFTAANSTFAGGFVVGPGGNTNIYFDSAKSISLNSDTTANIVAGIYAGTPRWTINAAGLVTMTGPLDMSNAASGQIVFPATQNASAGVNTLDDYVEGATVGWTPVLSFGGVTTGITYGTQTGSYTKIGRLIIAIGRITLTNKGAAAGLASIAGLPFSANASYAFPVSVGYYTGMSGLTGSVQGFAAGLNVVLNQGGAAAISQLTNTQYTNTSDIAFSVAYWV